MHIEFIILFFIAFLPLLDAAQYLYVSASGDNVMESYKIDESGRLMLAQKIELGGSPGNSVLSPDGNFLYVVVSGKDKVGITTLSIDKNGLLKEVAFGATPIKLTYVTIDPNGKYLFGAHYADGKISSYKLENGLYTGQILEFMVTDKNAHCARIDSKGEYIYFPHTGPNGIFQYKFQNEKLIALSPKMADGPDKGNNYHEPRHLVFHPQLKCLYTSNEFGGGISRWSIAKDGTLKIEETFKTVPQNINWQNAASDIQISSNGKLAFVANRDITDKKDPKGNDSISVFKLDEKGNITKQTGIFPLGRHPRCLCIDVSGKFIFGSAVDSSEITVYVINYESGTLSFVDKLKTSKNPLWMVSIEK